MKKALYAGSFDPVTWGHLDIIERGSRQIDDELTIGIGVNPDKKYTFSIPEREQLLRACTSHIPNVKVTSFRGLLADFAVLQDIDVVLRGERNMQDAAFEGMASHVIKQEHPHLELVTIKSDQNKTHVSSSMTKGIQKEQGDVTSYVPLPVKQALEARMSDQYILGVTGVSGAGKSFVSAQIRQALEEQGVEAIHIDLDTIGHEILNGSLSAPLYQKVITKISSTFGEDCVVDGVINRKALGPQIFGNPQNKAKLDEIMRLPMLMCLREKMFRHQVFTCLMGRYWLNWG